MCRHALQHAVHTYVDTGAVKAKKHALVIDGATLHKCMDAPKATKKARGPRLPGQTRPVNPNLELLFRLTLYCSSVICCRTTPLQKANIVRMVKRGKEGSVCLSIGAFCPFQSLICVYLYSFYFSLSFSVPLRSFHRLCAYLSPLCAGDGANDVSMIKEAHVGVGVMGREGTQAARTADYAMGEFRHLRRLISVCGRYSYLRLASFVQYFLYKNLAFTLCQVRLRTQSVLVVVSFLLIGRFFFMLWIIMLFYC